MELFAAREMRQLKQSTMPSPMSLLRMATREVCQAGVLAW